MALSPDDAVRFSESEVKHLFREADRSLHRLLSHLTTNYPGGNNASKIVAMRVDLTQMSKAIAATHFDSNGEEVSWHSNPK